MTLMPARGLRSRPSVSVIIPHYNYGDYLPFSVESALDQDGIDVEIIIVDDKSTDGSSVAVARALAGADARITLVEHEINLRHIRTYNDGLSRATGDYVVLLSADDALTTNSLSRSIALMEAHPRIGLVYGAVEWFDGAIPNVPPRTPWWRSWTGEQWVDALVRRGRNAIVNPEAVMRRSVYEKTGGYDPDFPHAGDLYMWLQAASFADVGFVGGPRQAFYRDHGANMHSTTFGGVLDDMAQVRDVYERYFANDGAVFADAHDKLVRARRSVAREALLRGALLTSSGAPATTLASLREFAVQTSPGIESSLVWKWASLGESPGRSRRMVAAGESLRWKLRSRRHLAVGL